MGCQELRAIVETPEFQRAFRMYAKGSVEGRQLWSLYHLAMGTAVKKSAVGHRAGTKEKRAVRAHMQLTASGSALRQSQRSDGDGSSERISV